MAVWQPFICPTHLRLRTFGLSGSVGRFFSREKSDVAVLEDCREKSCGCFLYLPYLKFL